LMFFILITLQDSHGNICRLFVCLDLDLFVRHKSNLNVDFLIRIEFTHHRSYFKNFLCFLFYWKVVFDWVLALILQEKWQFLGFTNTNCIEI
jgi:hypothetical protein